MGRGTERYREKSKKDAEKKRKNRSLCTFVLLTITLCFFLIGCSTPNPAPEATTETSGLLPLPTVQSVPPTFTPSGAQPVPTPSPIPTQAVQATDVPATPIPFDDVVLTAQMRIPAIGYDRRLEGNIGSELIFVDESAARGQYRVRQAVILIELQQALADLVLAPVPPDCDECVELSVTFPLEEVEVSGWLQDPVLMASLENLFAVTLGPHFSEEAVAGLRRTASPYAPAQTIEVTADGTVWIWQGNQERVVASFAADEALMTAVSNTVNLPFQTQYAASCEGIPVETLMLESDSGGTQQITIACPAFALPLSLLDLYAQLDALMNEAVLDAIPIPETALPLTAVLQYQRQDEVTLTLYQDGALLLQTPTETITDTLAVERLISLTTPLVEEEIVTLGLGTFLIEDEDEKANLLFVRGSGGVYDAAWAAGETAVQLQPLDTLIESYLNPDATPDGTAMPTTQTPEARETAVASPTPTPPSETSTPTPTP